ncbi:MAG TPA: hypothetical protein VD973_28805, partial [Symbiobacteriaceae bacterium]|nr:hypothetical protein [Symbiobacteriaceae bacterium]
VPAAPGTAAFASASKTVSGGTLTPLEASPGATIYAADGSGALALPATYVSAGQTGLTLSFTYTAAAGGINNGTVTLTVPAGWTPPSTTATAPGYVTASTGTVTATGQTVKVDGVTLSGGARMTITYSAATAPATPGTASFTGQSKATAGGTLANLSAPVTATIYAPDGSGTLTLPQTYVSPGQAGVALTFTYTAAAGGLKDGTVTVAVPTGWTAPSTTSTAPGYTTASTGTVTATGQTIRVDGVTLSAGGTLTITYSAATAANATGTASFAGQSKATAGGTLKALGAPATAQIMAANGSGTLTLPPTKVSANQRGLTLTFTYTAATGGMKNGTVTVTAPAGWSAPSTTATAAGYTTASSGTVTTAGQTIRVDGVTLNAGATLTITYSAATASAATGTASFTGHSRSTPGGTLANLSAPATATVYAPDGSGTLALPATNVSAGQTGLTLPFTYTAATGGLNNGTVTLTVPSGWTPPSTTATAAGYVTASTGTVTVTGQTIRVDGVTLNAGATMTITYSAATASATPGTASFAGQSKATAGGTLTNLSAPASATVYAADGSGALTLPETNLSAGQGGRTLTFTYTAAAGGMKSGAVTLTVPAGWTPPSTTSTAPGYTTASAGTVTVTGQTIKVDGVTLAAGGTLTITYSAATASTTPGAAAFTGQSKATAGGTLKPLSVPATATIFAADGSGTLAVDPRVITEGGTGATLTFTYTAAPGGMKNGAITVMIPDGWSAPSLTPTDAGYTKSSTGVVSVSGRKITISGLTLGAGQTAAITYGDRSGGGPGAPVPATEGTYTFIGQQQSTGGSALMDLTSAPTLSLQFVPVPPEEITVERDPQTGDVVLRWNAGSRPDVTYLVYRSTMDGSELGRHNQLRAAPVLVNGVWEFRDSLVHRGAANLVLVYWVVAVDSGGRQSLPSTPIYVNP